MDYSALIDYPTFKLFSSILGFYKLSESFLSLKIGTRINFCYFYLDSIGMWLFWDDEIYTSLFMNSGSLSGSPFTPKSGGFWIVGIKLMGTIV